jgi:hypothetical protein
VDEIETSFGSEVAVDIDNKTLTAAHEALNRAVNIHLRDPNVSLVDLGWRIRDSQGGRVDVGDLRVRVHVRQKYSERAANLESFAPQHLVSEAAIGFPVDVPRANYRANNWLWFPPSHLSSPTPIPVFGHDRNSAHSPMRGGISVAGAFLSSYGTLGGKVIDRQTRAEMLLSNWHVLVASWAASPGTAVYQPVRGNPNNIVARLTRDGLGQYVDAAVATLTGSRRLENNQLGLGPVKGSGGAQRDMAVIKSGVRTGITTGMITGTDGRLLMNYGGYGQVIRGVVHIAPPGGFENQTVSEGGDSGSWWLEQNSRKAVGLHFAGDTDPDREYALAIDMPLVLDTLNVDVALS